MPRRRGPVPDLSEFSTVCCRGNDGEAWYSWVDSNHRPLGPQFHCPEVMEGSGDFLFS
jgi:hypothetical protein